MYMVHGTTFKKIKKTKVVPGTKYGVFRYVDLKKVFKILQEFNTQQRF
jgi:hypothetical protein